MAFFSFYKPQEPTKYRYRPIYHDPKKEEMERRVRRIQREIDGDNAKLSAEDYKDLLRNSLRHQSKHLRRAEEKGQTISSRNKMTWKLILIAVILAALYYAFKYMI